MYPTKKNNTGINEVEAVMFINISSKLSTEPIPKAGTNSNTVTITACTYKAFTGVPFLSVLAIYLPKIPSGISENNTLTGAAVHKTNEPKEASIIVNPTMLVIMLPTP